MRDTLDKPNIIVINCDDLGYGDLVCYGSRKHDTPHIDRMAAEGTRFLDFYQASPVCTPSRAAMLTGCHPRRIGLEDVLHPAAPTGLSPSEITFATLLRHQGYATQIIGKWHCGDQPEFLPTRHGFDHYYGVPYSNDMGRQLGRENRPPLPLLRDEEVIEAQFDQAAVTERYVEEAVRFIRGHRDDPFLLYFAHMHVHVPIYAPQRFAGPSRNGRYGAGVACIDWSVGVLLYELRRLGIEKNTLVLFTSDNGSRNDFGESNDPLRGTKATTWEGGLRVPMVAWWPDQVPSGHSCSELITGMDLLPTFAHLAGATTPQDRIIDGRDILPLLRGENGSRSPHEQFFYYCRVKLDAVRAGRWKLFVGHHGRDICEENVCELYDLEKDFGETTNVASAHPDVVRDLMGRLEACRRDIGDGVTGAPGENRRPSGRVTKPKPLAEFDPNSPYFQAIYDLPDRG